MIFGSPTTASRTGIPYGIAVCIATALSVPIPALAAPARQPAAIEPIVRVVDLKIGELVEVDLPDGSNAKVQLLDVAETRDRVSNAVRRAVVTVLVNGQRAELVAATYHLPQAVAGVQIDCSVTRGYNENGNPSFWGLEKDARLRLWPAKSPWLRPGSFTYPVKQRWFATDTQMANDPVYVDGGERAGERKIYYHSGLDIGGSEGLTEVVAATDALVVSVGDAVLDGHREDTPVSPRYDVVYLLDGRGWYYRYSHLKEIDEQILPGRIIAQGDRIGLLGKEGGSGGWSHLHFEIKSRQPSGRWGTQEGYAFLWEAYRRQHDPAVIAVARPHHVIYTGETVTLDGRRSWAKSGEIEGYQWRFGDGTTADTATARRTYSQPGRYSEVLQVTDKQGNVDYDFAVVVVVDRQHPERLIPSIHPNYFPTFGIRTGDEITFKVRTFNNTTSGRETWDFGDGSPAVEVQSDGNAVKLAPDGYAVTTHRYAQPGDYIVSVSRTNEHGVTAVGHLDVHVAGQPLPQDHSPSPGLSPVRVSDSGTHFVLADRSPWVIWGVNYDHDGTGRLLDEYWHDEWAAVVEDFREIRELGANCVRVHLQLGQFMTSPEQPNAAALKRLAMLVKLAEETRLYLDITGLACYHKKNIPPWYDGLPEAERWAVQARFWEAVAEVCCDSPAIFCYDLMNEPILPGKKAETDWLAGELGGKFFVQRLALDRRGRTPQEIAEAWVKQMVAAIRKHDGQHMITVGVIPWVFAFGGGKPLFYSPEVGRHLDFVAVHFYPKKGEVEKAIQALKAYEVGKPLVVEEMFPLKCGQDELEQFIQQSRSHVDGWVSFYWGETADQLRQKPNGGFAAAITAAWLERFQKLAQEMTAP